MKLGPALRRHSHAIALFAIVLASLAFRVHVSKQCSLWLDEVLTHQEVGAPWPVVLGGPERVHPPLLFVLVKLVVSLFGGSATSLRAVSLVFGCVLLLATDWLCAELGLTPARRLGAVVALAITPFFLRHATEARQYALFPALGTLATAATLRLLREPTRVGILAVFAASAGAMAATQYFGLAYALALLGVVTLGTLPAWLRMELPTRQRLTAALLVLASYYSENYDGAGTSTWQSLLELMVRHFAFTTANAVGLVQPLLAAAGLVLLGRSLAGLARIVPAALTFAPCVGALFITSGHFVAPRYLAPAWVLYEIGTCAALFALGDLLRRTAARLPAMLAVALAWLPFVAPVGLRLAEYPDAFGTGDDDYRGLQRYFLEHLRSDTALVTYVGRFGDRIMGSEYSVGRRPIPLERFRPVPGVQRYLLAEIHVHSSDRGAQLESLVQSRMGIPLDVWRALAPLDLPGTTYQPPVTARLIVFDGNTVKLPPVHRQRRDRAPRHRRRPVRSHVADD
jgi:hypothetical protein